MATCSHIQIYYSRIRRDIHPSFLSQKTHHQILISWAHVPGHPWTGIRTNQNKSNQPPTFKSRSRLHRASSSSSSLLIPQQQQGREKKEKRQKPRRIHKPKGNPEKLFVKSLHPCSWLGCFHADPKLKEDPHSKRWFPPKPGWNGWTRNHPKTS